MTLTYDARNRLTSVNTGTANVTFGYDDGGERLWKKVGTALSGVWIGGVYEEKDGKTLCT